MLKGFKAFLLRGNVIDLAVAVVVGTAFTAIVTSIVGNIINPLIGLIFDAKKLDNSLVWHVGSASVKFGSVLGSVISFVIIAAIAYFVFVLPMSRFIARRNAEKGIADDAVDAPTEIELLSEIRDLLAKGEGGKHADAAGPTSPASGSATPSSQSQ